VLLLEYNYRMYVFHTSSMNSLKRLRKKMFTRKFNHLFIIKGTNIRQFSTCCISKHNQPSSTEEYITTRKQQKKIEFSQQHNNIVHPDFLYLIPMKQQVQELKNGQKLSKSDKHFINLTNGLEVVHEDLGPLQAQEMQFVRMQSSHLEANNYAAFLQELDHNMLMQLALGYNCYIYDYGCRKTGDTIGQARALWQGIAWTRFVLNRLWLDRLTDDDPVVFLDNQKKVRNTDHYPDFRRQMIPSVSNHRVLRRRLKYFEKYVDPTTMPNGVKLFGVYNYTPNDFRDDYYVSCAAQIREHSGVVHHPLPQVVTSSEPLQEEETNSH
jgi:hypothetical protein